jgi:uncharacterized protein YjeT (DUF2065 family)
MLNTIIQYSVSIVLTLTGLFSLFKAYTWKKNQIEMYREFIHPLPKNYGRGYLIFLGLVLLTAGIALLFLQKK